MTDEQPYFTAQNTGLGTINPSDELLHPVPEELRHIDSVTETQYFGFCIPEKEIHGFCYLWHHPNLKIVTGGLFVHQGDKRTVTHSELCDYKHFMSDRVLKDDLHEFRLDNGYGVKIIEPFERHHVTYKDDLRKNSIDLDYRSAGPAVMFGDSTHFDQPMRVSGELVLRGEVHRVDCYTMRDRSWAKPRSEAVLPIPGVTWMQAVFSDDFSFCCTAHDHLSGAELIDSAIALPDEKTLNGGWIRRNGENGLLVSARKRVSRIADGMPGSVDLELTDILGRTISVTGEPVTSVAFTMWPNMFMSLVLMRWECEGHVAYGDFQDGLWNDQLNLLAK